jgi:hypothetical protein
MTAEELYRKQAQMADSELIDLCKAQVSQLAKTYGKSHKMSVPPQITDTDMLLSELIRRFTITTIQQC